MLNKNRAIQQAVSALPKLAKRITPWVPKFLSEKAIEQSLNLFFKTDIQAGKLDFMLNRRVKIDVTDIGLVFYVSGQIERQQLVLKVTQANVPFDVSMAGSMHDLYLLMTQYVDPDTLFFRRRLQLRGDTELGLELKNFLDTVELATRLPKKVHAFSLEIAEQIGAYNQSFD